jgi:lipopolysaccharide export LptBFGC system permease protein LptF
MLLYLVVSLIAGIAVGYLLRRRRQVNLGRVTFGVILLLIFSLGFSIGSNGDLLGSLPRVGASAVVIVLLAVGFSVTFVKVAGRLVKLD